MPGVDSAFVIDLPGKRHSRTFQSADLMGAHFAPASPGYGHAGEHISGTGVVVPADSAPAHIVIVPDQELQIQLDKWGLTERRKQAEDNYRGTVPGVTR